jgi:hypothetical protein
MSRMTNEKDGERYTKLVRIAPAESIELVNEEAFDKLSADERDEMFGVLETSARTADEKPADASPAALAAAASRQEHNRPGALGRLFGRDDETDPSSGLFATFVAYAVGSQLAFALLASTPFPEDGAEEGDDGGGFLNPGLDGFDGGF